MPRPIIDPREWGIDLSQDDYVADVWDLWDKFLRVLRNRGEYRVKTIDDLPTYYKISEEFALWVKAERGWREDLPNEDVLACLMPSRKADSEKRRKAARLAAFRSQKPQEGSFFLTKDWTGPWD